MDDKTIHPSLLAQRAPPGPHVARSSSWLLRRRGGGVLSPFQCPTQCSLSAGASGGVVLKSRTAPASIMCVCSASGLVCLCGSHLAALILRGLGALLAGFQLVGFVLPCLGG
jgi:hypothetical protein